MLNVEEFVCPEMRVAPCHVKESMRCVLHTLMVCRSIGGHRPIEPRSAYSELFDVSYLKTDESELEQELEQTVRQFSELLESGASPRGRAGQAQLVLNFYTEKKRKQSVWNMLVGSDERIVFEQWRIPVAVQALRRHPTPAENLKEEALVQDSASKQVQVTLHFIIAKANAKIEHLPPPPQSHAAYKFEVSFATLDGKSIGGASALLPQGFGSSLSKTIKHIPYIA